ncbi:MAG TPA: glycosyltransferase family 39 protein [Thermoanaerobaculia bacterium]|nr:glycosyltransferase family 39 protein [Thermoanaerobaculia bacterium]
MTRQKTLALALLIVAISLFISPWLRDLFVGDETKYSQIIREMRSADSFFVPRLNGSPYTHKPPLHFWMIYLLAIPFGALSIWPYVIPSLVAFVAMLFLMRRLGEEFFPASDAGMISAFIFATSFLAWGLAQTARMDLSFIFCISLTALLLKRFIDGENPRDLYLSAVVTGIGIMIKGPMAFVIPLFLMVLQRFRRKSLPRASYLGAFLIAAGIPLLWLIPAVIIGGGEFAREILITQNVGRAVGSWVHRSPPWFYVIRAPLTFFPWFLLAVIALLTLYRTRERAGAVLSPISGNAMFLVHWVIAVLVPFSLISGKLDIYMLPAFPPLALLMGDFVARRSGDSWARAAFRANLITTLLVGVIGLVGLIGGSALVRRADEKALMTSPSVRTLLMITVAASVIGFVCQLLLRSDRLFHSTILTGLTAVAPLIALSIVLLPTANQNLSTAPLVATLERQPGAGRDIALYACPFLWSRDLTPRLNDARYIGAEALGSGSALPIVIASRSTRTHELGKALPENYRKVDEVKIKGMQFDVYRRK